jgi:hypothetical protein
MDISFGDIHIAISNLAIVAGVLLTALIVAIKNP